MIRAESEEAARLIAATAALNDDNNMHLRLASGDDRPWLYPKSTSCEVVPVEGDAAVVLAAAYPG